METLTLPYCEDGGGSSSSSDGEDGAAACYPSADEFPAIPNEDFPSDHLAMGCVLQLLPAAAGGSGTGKRARDADAARDDDGDARG